MTAPRPWIEEIGTGLWVCWACSGSFDQPPLDDDHEFGRIFLYENRRRHRLGPWLRAHKRCGLGYTTFTH